MMRNLFPIVMSRIYKKMRPVICGYVQGGYAIYSSASDVFNRNVEAWMWNVGLTGNPSLVYIDKEKTFWIYINGKGVYSYREGQKNAVAVKGG